MAVVFDEQRRIEDCEDVLVMVRLAIGLNILPNVLRLRQAGRGEDGDVFDRFELIVEHLLLQ